MCHIHTGKVLYVGDSIKNDAFPASRVAHWGALLILEAMEVEGCESPDPEKNNCHCKVLRVNMHLCLREILVPFSVYSVHTPTLL